MLRFHADGFCRASSLLGQMYMQIRFGRMPQAKTWSVVGAEVVQLLEACENMGLVATVAQIRRVQHMLITATSSDFNLDSFGREIIEIQTRLNDELEARLVLAVDSDKCKYFTCHQFPNSVADRFPDASFDMEEAAKCYALQRPTACVFHLMRITEYALHEVGRMLGIKQDRPNWEPIILKIDAELKLPYKERKFQGNADMLAHVSAHLNAVKIAWRNRAMHVDKKHTMEEAQEIYEATRGLMRYIAENLAAAKATSTISVP